MSESTRTPTRRPESDSMPSRAGYAFPDYPVSWHLFGETRELMRGPVTKSMLGRKLVAYRTAGGHVAVLDAACSHMGADLGKGCVIGERIRCPYHHWEYGPDGHCERIPITPDIPAFARQRCYPAEVRHGLIFFFNGPKPLFPLPFFSDAPTADFVRAQPFVYVVDCPWYMISGNGFDFQHLHMTHDRRLDGPSVVRAPSPYARQATTNYVVEGHSLSDRIIRWLCGDKAQMNHTDWCGTLIFATSTFRRTKTYGLLAMRPLGADRVMVQSVVFLPRSRHWIGRLLLDPIKLRIRRHFVKAFLREDVESLSGTRYSPRTLLDADKQFDAHLGWLASASRGVPQDIPSKEDAGQSR